MKICHALGLATLVLSSALAMSGCCGGKVAECNKLIGVINNNAEAIKTAGDKLNQASGNDLKALEDAASTLDKAASDIKTVEIKDETLKGFSKEYETMFTDGGKALRDAAKAAKGNDLGALTKATTEISKMGSTEAALVSKVNGYCSK
jgi:methyl-accepting chemotaxis protein